MWTVPKYGTTTGNIKPGDGTTNFCLDGKDGQYNLHASC